MAWTRPGSVPDTLRAAAAYIRRYGWHPGPGLYDAHDGCTPDRCRTVRSGMFPASVYGAVRAALVGVPKWFLTSTPAGVPEAYEATVTHLTSHLDRFGSAGLRAPLWWWEHATGRTREQVVNALLAAASTAPARPFPPVDPARLAPVIPLPTRTDQRPDCDPGGPSAVLFQLSAQSA